MASCGPLTFICVFLLFVVAASLAFAGDDDVKESPDDIGAVSYVYRRSAGRRATGVRRGGRRGNEGIAVDGTGSGGRRGGRRRGNNNGGRRTGGRRGGRGRGHGRGRGRGRNRGRERPAFSRRERNLIGRLTAASAQFALQMYNILDQENTELIFSPHSIHTALTMTYLGARESTARQMIRVLGLQRLRKRKAHMAYTALTNSLTNSGNVTLNVANAVYVKPNLPIEEAFRTGLQNMYRAEFEHFDFDAVGGPEAPINAWVAMKTANKIQDFLAPNTITPLTAMIIINAIYFKGKWKDPFEAEQTTEQTFYQDGGASTQVQMMTRTGNYNYTRADDLSAHIVEIPYEGDRFSMYVILPVSRNTLDDVEQRMTLENLNNNLQSMNSVRVELYLPKFKSESKFSVKETLRSMGMVVPFSARRANFSGICSVHELFISDVIHQAVVEVSEEGTEAAAATGVVIGLRSFHRPTIEVRADHPFIYAIRDNLSQSWLFMGKYSAQQTSE